MGKLADIAGAKKGLTGKVSVTDEKGFTTVYADEAAAEAALPSGAEVEHRRGAFYITGTKSRKKKRSDDPATVEG